MKRSAFAAALLTLAAGCSSPGGDSSNSTPPSNPYAECLAASRSWKTLLAHFRRDGADGAEEIVFAAERGGRISITGSRDGAGCVLSGHDMTFASGDDGASRIGGTVDMGLLVDLGLQIASGDEVKREPAAASTPLFWTLHWDCPVDVSGKAELALNVRASRDEAPLFGWLGLLQGGAGVTITAEPATFTVDSPEGRYVIDRRTGLLTFRGRQPAAGTPVTLTLTKLEVDVPLPESLFDTSLDPAPPKSLRHFFAQAFIRQAIFDSLSGELDTATRRRKCLAGVAPFYEFIWTPAERSRVAAEVRTRIEARAAELQRQSPELTAGEAWTAAGSIAEEAVGDQVKEEVYEDFGMLFQVTLLEGEEARASFWQDFGTEVRKSLLNPIVEAAQKR